eukprot:m.125435 g.125435  ORF g.125435 m.125435 type:complete len:299 (+) comp13797_c0_seq1:248-1144(+)
MIGIGTILAIVGGVTMSVYTLPLILFAGACFVGETERGSRGMLGLNSVKRKEHATLVVKGIKHWTDWAASLSRSPRTTLLKQVDKARASTGYVIEQRRSLSLSHFIVVFNHQQRYYRAPLALLSALFRMMPLVLSKGNIDNFVAPDGTLLGFSLVIIKGKALRGMWFYQRQTSHIWFECVRLHVQRAIQMECDLVDLGPSTQEHVAALKVKFGFSNDTPWWEAYEGNFSYPIDPTLLTMEKPKDTQTQTEAMHTSTGSRDSEPALPSKRQLKRRAWHQRQLAEAQSKESVKVATTASS